MSARARAAEVVSTTGTAPIRFRRAPRGKVLVTTENGAGQVYEATDLVVAVLGMFRRSGVPTVDDLHALATHLDLEVPELAPSRLRWIE